MIVFRTLSREEFLLIYQPNLEVFGDYCKQYQPKRDVFLRERNVAKIINYDGFSKRI